MLTKREKDTLVGSAVIYCILAIILYFTGAPGWAFVLLFAQCFLIH